MEDGRISAARKDVVPVSVLDPIYLGDKREALRSALELNDRFEIPLPKHKVIITTKSAEKAWEASLDLPLVKRK